MKVRFLVKNILALLIATGCGNLETRVSEPVQAQGCTNDTAIILVWDTVFENYCGCEGTNQNGTFQTPGTPLVCQVSQGKTVFFYFVGTVTFHQIISTDSPEKFLPSMIQSTTAENRPWGYSVQISESGTTYNYQDHFNDQMVGQIVVP